MKKFHIALIALIFVLTFSLTNIFADKQSKIIACDSNYVKYENGIIYDENTGLEWLAGPEEACNFINAKA